jgi:hypothetical protein
MNFTEETDNNFKKMFDELKIKEDDEDVFDSMFIRDSNYLNNSDDEK